jgi:hypothetical protein
MRSNVNADRDSCPFFVPVNASQSGTMALRTGRLVSGQPIGLAFTSAALLLSTMGPSQQWARLCEAALRDLLAPLGVDHIRIDPHPVRAVASSARPEITEPNGAEPGRVLASDPARPAAHERRNLEHRPAA